MAQSVFLSYARESASDAATKLYDALGGPEVLAFCDISDIEAGECLPESLSNVLLNSTVVVVFADSTYFTRWYCLRELRMALGPFEAALRDPIGKAGAGCASPYSAPPPADGSKTGA